MGWGADDEATRIHERDEPLGAGWQLSVAARKPSTPELVTPKLVTPESVVGPRARVPADASAVETAMAAARMPLGERDRAARLGLPLGGAVAVLLVVSATLWFLASSPGLAETASSAAPVVVPAAPDRGDGAPDRDGEVTKSFTID